MYNVQLQIIYLWRVYVLVWTRDDHELDGHLFIFINLCWLRQIRNELNVILNQQNVIIYKQSSNIIGTKLIYKVKAWGDDTLCGKYFKLDNSLYSVRVSHWLSSSVCILNFFNIIMSCCCSLGYWLVLTALGVIGLIFLSPKSPVKLAGVYTQPGKWYWLKVAAFYILMKVRKVSFLLIF